MRVVDLTAALPWALVVFLLASAPGFTAATVSNNTLLLSGTLNQTAGSSYNWTINLSSTLGILDNITSVSLNGFSATRYASAVSETTAVGGNWTVWAYYATPESLNGSWDDACGGHFTKAAASDADGSATFTSDSVYQMVPCLKANTSVPSSVSASATQINVTPPAYAEGDFQVLMPAVTFNSTHKYCPYTADNVKRVQANLTPESATIYHCLVDFNRSGSDVGIVPVYQAGYLSEVPPRGSGITTNVVVFILGAAAAALLPSLSSKVAR